MNPWTFAVAATALAVERVAYAAIWRRPDLYARACRRLAARLDPVDVLSALFVGFKAIQLLVFLSWCLEHGRTIAPVATDVRTWVAGAVLIGAGQWLNLSVFARLGRVGVFYGNRLGHDVPWVQGFPFSLVRHPQYVGAVLSIWGFFVLMRYPAPDWIALPLLETIYYAVGARLEQGGAEPEVMAAARSTAADRRASRRLR